MCSYLIDLIKNNQIESAIELINSGCEVNIQDEKERTPLHWAIIRGHYNLLPDLISAGALVNANDMYDETPLSLCLTRDHLPSVEILIRSGADVNFVGCLQWPYLHLAVEQNNFEAVKILIKEGVNILNQDTFGRDALNFAHSRHNQKIIDFIAKSYATQEKSTLSQVLCSCSSSIRGTSKIMRL